MKPLLTAPKRQLIDVLQTQLIPWANSGAPIALLDAPPQVLGANRVTEKPGAALPSLQGMGQIVRVRYWREENLNSAAIPMLGCIVDGAADLEIGITQTLCQKLKIDGKRWIVALPKSTFFLIPPNIPISSVGQVHWRRAHPEKAYSRMLWIQIHEAGAYCHFNTSDKGKLWISPHLFLRNPHIFPLAHNLIQEIQLQSQRHLPIAYFHLGLILEYMLQSLLTPSKITDRIESAVASPTSSLFSSQQSLDERMQKIIAYIDENLANPSLSTESIAAWFHLSPAHLRRLFHRELSLSTMKFVSTRRLEFAQQLLLESSFNIEQVSRYCGFKYASNFTNAFIQHCGVSPSAFRNRAHPDMRNQ